MSNINIFLLDNLNNIKEEKIIIKPKSYNDFLEELEKNFKKIKGYYKIFTLDKDNKEISINNDEKYRNIEDIVFIRAINKKAIRLSIYERNYDELSESKQEILDEKYNCNICSNIIKNENPFLCYICQKIYHEECLKDWDKKRKSENEKLSCPNCRNQLEIEKWNKKLYFEEDRIDNANLMNKINEYRLKSNMKNNINIIKEKKINELNYNKIKQDEIITTYENFIEKTLEIFKNILNAINSISVLLTNESNKELNIFMDNLSSSSNNLNIDALSNLINKELLKIRNDIIKMNNNKMNIKQKNNIFEKNDLFNNNVNNINNNFNSDNINDINNINKVMELRKNDYENKINIVFHVKNKGDFEIFGVEFVKNNKDNIELIINGVKNKLSHLCSLNGGKNIITLIIKNKLTDLSYMFYKCKLLRNIRGLDYLDVSECISFKYMFYECSLLSDIKGLQNWNVSNVKNFRGMFWDCSSLPDIEPLQNWDVSNGENFGYMFSECLLLENINSLLNWNVSNCNNFEHMFTACSSLSDIKALRNWNVSNSNNFSSMFSGCFSLLDIKYLENWDVSEGEIFNSMFYKCSSLSDLTPLKNWNVSKGKDFGKMFSECMSLSDISPLKNWNVSKNKFKSMI